MNYLENVREFFYGNVFLGFTLTEVLIAGVLFLVIQSLLCELKGKKIQTPARLVFSLGITLLFLIGLRTFHIELLITGSRFVSLFSILFILTIILIVTMHRTFRFPPIARKLIWALGIFWLIFSQKVNWGNLEEAGGEMIAILILIILIILDKQIGKNLYNRRRTRT